MQVQEEMVRRANLRSGETNKKRVYSSKYALSSLVCCSKCGDIYRRVQWNNRGKRSTVWRCCTRVQQGPSACDARTIAEEDLQDVVRQAINQALGCKDAFLPALQANIEKVISGGADSETATIDTCLEELQKELLKRANSKMDYEEIAEEIYALREQKQGVLEKEAEREGDKQRMEEMITFLNEQPLDIREHDENLVRRLIQKVTVYEDKYMVEFKSGMKTHVVV